MRKIFRIISIILVITLLGTSIAFADDSDIIIQPRSRYLAGGISEITNEGEGVLSIYADFTSYDPVQWGSLTITLQKRKSASSGSWTDVKTYTYEFDADDEPDGELTYGYAEFEVHGLQTDYYYRVRCVHKVKTPDGTYESKTSQTSGVLLTSYPVFRSQNEGY
ncbi:MAG: hypothetical protein HFG76_01175 [Hungatella sp.]|nr:hypothetical protein [Hungatella sp.]